MQFHGNAIKAHPNNKKKVQKSNHTILL